ncbi:MAG: hypothetical protein Alpg2KO_20030 [Alphaproteobacteria bacterium]
MEAPRPVTGEPARMVETAARDEFVTVMLCPPEQRDSLFTLLAFAHQLRGIPDHVTEPMMGRIRYQWWRDQLQAIHDGEGAARHELSDGLQSFGKQALRLQDTVSGYETVLEQETAPQDTDELVRQAASCQMGLLRLLDGAETVADETLNALGAGVELSWRLRHSILQDFAAGRVFLPGDALASKGLTIEKLRDFRPGPDLFALVAETAQTALQSLPARTSLPKGPLRRMRALAERRLRRVVKSRGEFVAPAYDRPDPFIGPALWWAGR